MKQKTRKERVFNESTGCYEFREVGLKSYCYTDNDRLMIVRENLKLDLPADSVVTKYHIKYQPPHTDNFDNRIVITSRMFRLYWWEFFSRKEPFSIYAFLFTSSIIDWYGNGQAGVSELL